jgi:hypothetical protein
MVEACAPTRHSPLWGNSRRLIGLIKILFLMVQQRAALQLGGQSPATPEVLVQPRRE